MRSLPHDWYGAPLPDNVVIGERSWIYSSFAFLHYRSERPTGVQIGNDTGVYIRTMFDCGPDAEVRIGDYCTLAGPIISTNGRVEIGNYALISFQVTIADTPFAVPPPYETGDRRRTPDIVIGENAWIGARAVLLPGARVGEGAVVGAATIIDFDLPPYSTAIGSPPRVVAQRTRSRAGL